MSTSANHERLSGLDSKALRVSPTLQPSAEPPLTPEEIASFREHLQHMREWLLASIQEWETQSRRSARAVGFAAEADAAWEQSLAQRDLADKRLLLNEITQAFERIRENTFGRCISDNRRISRAVLEEVPWAQYCKSCASRHGV